VEASFNYLSVLLSIVLGLAITQVLQGLRGLILTRAKVKLYLPSLIWVGLVLLIAIQGWWASFGMRTQANWTFVALLVIILQAISVYMAAALVLPDVTLICGTTTLPIKTGSSAPFLPASFLVRRRISLALGICPVA
jgi:hypothetical protein